MRTLRMVDRVHARVAHKSSPGSRSPIDSFLTLMVEPVQLARHKRIVALWFDGI
jgi:hypothetical protein